MQPKQYVFALAIALSHFLYSQCPTNEADFANGGTFSGPCSVDYGNDVTITGAVVWTGGTMTMNDMDGTGLIIANGGSLTLQSGTFTLDDVDGGGNNDARMVVQAGGALTIQNGATFNVEDNIDINGTATVEAGGNFTITLAGEVEVTGTLDIYGTVTTAGAGADGNLEAVGGTINIYNGGFADVSDDLKAYNGGTIYVQTGGQIDVGDNMLNAQVGGGGNPSTGTFIIDGTVNVTDDITIFDTTPDSGLSGAGTINIDPGGSFTDNEGTSSFSGCGGGSSCSGSDDPLPVELIDFYFEDNSSAIELHWSTASEINNAGFHIERSFDGQIFEPIGFVAGSGTTNELNTYSFEDRDTHTNRYYRLLQVDFDGAFEYHPTIFASVNSVSDISVYPNPVVNQIRIGGNGSEIYGVTLLDVSGRTIYHSSEKMLSQVEQDLNRIIPNLSHGDVVFLKIESPEMLATHRLVKQ